MAFHAILAEDDSDAEAIRMLIRRVRSSAGLPRVSLKGHGCGGCGKLANKGARHIHAWALAGCERVFICCDSDTLSVEERHELAMRIIRDSAARIPCHVIVPVRELEAWFLADVAKLAHLFRWCAALEQPLNPESIPDPKKHIIRLSRRLPGHRTFYDPPTHNVSMAELVDLDLVRQRCPSFGALFAAAQA